MFKTIFEVVGGIAVLSVFGLMVSFSHDPIKTLTEYATMFGIGALYLVGIVVLRKLGARVGATRHTRETFLPEYTLLGSTFLIVVTMAVVFWLGCDHWLFLPLTYGALASVLIAVLAMAFRRGLEDATSQKQTAGG